MSKIEKNPKNLNDLENNPPYKYGTMRAAYQKGVQMSKSLIKDRIKELDEEIKTPMYSQDVNFFKAQRKELKSFLGDDK